MAIGLFNGGGGLWGADESIAGTPIYPVTRVMAEALNGRFAFVSVLRTRCYGGERVGGDREKRLHEIVDSTPAPDWAFVTPKVLALTLVLAATIAVGVIAGILVQASKGFTEFRL